MSSKEHFNNGTVLILSFFSMIISCAFGYLCKTYVTKKCQNGIQNPKIPVQMSNFRKVADTEDEDS
jgi:hypothetical protein